MKRAGAKRKQPDEEYSHQLFQLSAFIAENKYLPNLLLHGRPLYRYLMKDIHHGKKIGYKIQQNNSTFIQTVMSSYL